MISKKVVLIPLDPVHDVGIKLIARALQERRHTTVLLPPDLTPEEACERARVEDPDYIMVSRTISYGTAEVLAKFVDLCDAMGLRDRARLVVGGLSIRPEMAQEFGFDAGFGPATTPGEVADYVEGCLPQIGSNYQKAEKPDLTQGFTYSFRDTEIGRLCYEIGQQTLDWATRRSSPAVRRAEIRLEMAKAQEKGDYGSVQDLRAEYVTLCSGDVRRWYETGRPVAHTRSLGEHGIEVRKSSFTRYPRIVQGQAPLAGRNVMIQYGTGCPIMDSYHIDLSLAWGAKGVIHFDPSWGARTEGLLEGAVSHEHDGTVLTLENLNLIKGSLGPDALWQVRAHRGLNTPETVVLAHLVGADLTKVNIVYGSLGGGTDPSRLTVDGVESMRLAARFGLPFDVVTNEELCGVPARKAFAGMLVVAAIGYMLGGRPILQPLFANSPEAIVRGLTDKDYVDFNVAKMKVLRDIVDAPIWPGAPVGFLTQLADRSQSVTMTSLHAALAFQMGAVAVTIASSDEAYAGGPISGQARVDTLKSTAAALRFLGETGFPQTPLADSLTSELRDGILKTLKTVAARGDFASALYEGLFGDKNDGAYPGRAGRDTVWEIK